MRGFTLIETLIYIALLAFLLTSAVLTSYTLATNSDKLNVNTTTHDEGNFALRKMDWALGSLKTISVPSSGYSPTLTIVRNDGMQVNIRLTAGQIEMRNGITASYVPITTSNVSVSALNFGYLAGTPAGIEASTTINGVVFTTRRYLSK